MMKNILVIFIVTLFIMVSPLIVFLFWTFMWGLVAVTVISFIVYAALEWIHESGSTQPDEGTDEE